MNVVQKNLITSQTSLLGLLGNPVSHSISPAIQNAAFKEMNLNWCYLAMPCDHKNLQTILNGLRAINCKGLNITIPYKESVSKICSMITPIAQKVGAINTLIPAETNGWIGTNTDVEGFINPLNQLQWKGNKAIVLGCGGSARAVVAGLEALKLNEIIVVGRNPSKLEKFIRDLNSNNSQNINSVESLKGIIDKDTALKIHIKESDLVVNTTPVGMKNLALEEDDPFPVPLNRHLWENLKRDVLMYDLIYNPKLTPWLKWGKNHGYQVINGLEMLIQQGAASLRLWSGEEKIPINTMRKAANKNLFL